jgi:mannose-6-phosphate isomerase-like protein (cupin superfamily)
MSKTDSMPRELAVVGDAIRILLSGADTGGAYALVEDVVPPGGGPPPHVHRDEDEGFYVLEGDIEFLAGDRWVRVGAGGSFFGRRGLPHTFRNAGAVPARLMVVISPAGFERFFEEVDRMTTAAGHPPAPEALIALGAKYRLTFLPPG